MSTMPASVDEHLQSGPVGVFLAACARAGLQVDAKWRLRSNGVSQFSLRGSPVQCVKPCPFRAHSVGGFARSGLCARATIAAAKWIRAFQLVPSRARTQDRSCLVGASSREVSGRKSRSTTLTPTCTRVACGAMP
eukprot:12390165-Alexandrium_andersonii.AAC.1